MITKRFGALLTAGLLAQLGMLTASAPAAAAAPELIVPAATSVSSCGGTGSHNTDFRAVHFNVLGSRYTTKTSWKNRRDAVVKRMTHVLNNTDTDLASIYGLTEVNSTEATWLAKQLGPNYAVGIQAREQAIIFDTTTWTVQDRDVHAYKAGSDNGHGFVHLRLKNTSSGAQVNVVEAHLSPNDAKNGAANRPKQLRQIKSTVGSWENPVLILGDMNWNAPGFETAAGPAYCSVRVFANSYSPAGAKSYGTVGKYATKGKIYDYGLVHNGITMRTYRVLTGYGKAKGSDHHMLTLQLTL